MDGKAQVVRRVRELVESGFYQFPSGTDAVAGDPLPVVNPGGSVHSWLAPFISAGKLVAWAVLTPRMEPLRFSVFPAATAPDAASWLDARHIAARISRAAGEPVGEAVLTYDRNPSRLVWMAESHGRSGLRRWFAAGEFVWEDTGDEEVTGEC